MEILLRTGERLIAVICITAAAILLPLMIVVRVWDIYLRNIPNKPSALYGAMESEALVLLIFLSLAYAYTRDAHVRVDIFRERFTPRARAWTELIAAVLFVMPFAITVVYHGTTKILGVAEVGQRCALGLGGPCAWMIQSSMPVGIGLFGLASLIVAIRNLRFLIFGIGEPAPKGKDLAPKTITTNLSP